MLYTAASQIVSASTQRNITSHHQQSVDLLTDYVDIEPRKYYQLLNCAMEWHIYVEVVVVVAMDRQH